MRQEFKNVHLERDPECRHICDSCLNGLEAQYGIQFVPVLVLALHLPISFISKLPLNYLSSLNSHVGQVNKLGQRRTGTQALLLHCV